MWLLGALLGCTDGAPPADVCDPPELAVRSPSPRSATADRPEVASLAASVNTLGAEILAQTEATNVAFSPLSLTGMFSLLMPGLDATTAGALADVLHVDQDLDLHHAALSSLLGDLDDTERGWAFAAATHFWHMPNLSPEPAWTTRVNGLYGMEASPLDFQGDPEGSRTTMNTWISDRTRCLIPEFFPEGYDFSTKIHIAMQVMVLDAAWETPFDAAFTADRPFQLTDGSTASVATMSHRDFAGAVAQADGLTRVRLPYAGDDLAMYVVMPDAPSDPKALLTGASAATFDAWADVGPDGTFALELPKWTVKSEHSVYPGPLDATYGPLDSLPIPGVCDGCLMPDIVRQVAVVLVDEAGTRAAAATSGESDESDPQWTTIDKPFLWFLRDDKSGAVLWVGWVTNPSQAAE